MHQLDELALKSTIAITKEGFLSVNAFKFSFKLSINE